MSPISVTDSLSNRDEHVVELARRVGRGHKRLVFEAVYRGQKGTKSVIEIARAIGLSETQVLKAGVALVAAHAIHQTEIKGRVAYSKIVAHKAIKDKVLKIAGDKNAIDSIATKRTPRLLREQSLFVEAPQKRVLQKPKNAKARKRGSSAAKVAFLLSSPSGAGAINVGMDYREASAAVQSSSASDMMDLQPFPAAHVGTLLDALNEFKPDAIQFSGHGGGKAILLDRLEVATSGGMAVNFSVVRNMLAATEKRPTLLVFAACQTVSGVEILLDTVPLVIAMSDNISDWAAAFFSRRFYAALVSGQSIGHAFDQAKSFLSAEGLPDADLPTLLSREGVDPYSVRLVEPKRTI